MSFEERKNANKWRLNKEITLGDLFKVVCVGGPLIVALVHLIDKVDDHEKRMVATEQAIVQQARDIARHDTEIEVMRAKVADKTTHN